MGPIVTNRLGSIVKLSVKIDFIFFQYKLFIDVVIIIIILGLVKKMPRKRVRTTSRGTTSDSTMKTAALLCLDEHMSERSVATSLNICHVSLNRYIKKFKLHRETGSSLPSVGYRPHSKVFNEIHEKQLVNYIKKLSRYVFWFKS